MASTNGMLIQHCRTIGLSNTKVRSMANNDLIDYIHFERKDYQLIYCVFCESRHMKYYFSCSNIDLDDVQDYNGSTNFSLGA